jgi:hypothetical protein
MMILCSPYRAGPRAPAVGCQPAVLILFTRVFPYSTMCQPKHERLWDEDEGEVEKGTKASDDAKNRYRDDVDPAPTCLIYPGDDFKVAWCAPPPSSAAASRLLLSPLLAHLPTFCDDRR